MPCIQELRGISKSTPLTQNDRGLKPLVCDEDDFYPQQKVIFLMSDVEPRPILYRLRADLLYIKVKAGLAGYIFGLERGR